MSHFTVLARLSDKRIAAHDGIEGALTEMLAPFEDCPDDGRFLVFEDEEDGWREEYESKDESGAKRRGEYKTFAAFCESYHGGTRDPETGRFGHRRNPNAKWDWWQVGGRWRGFFPLKEGETPVLGKPSMFGGETIERTGDIVRPSQIDFDLVARKTTERIDKFFADYSELLNGKRFQIFEGPESTAMDLGLMKTEQATVESTESTIALPWRNLVPATDARASWTYVCKRITRDDLLAMSSAFHPLTTYAALDNDGWHAPGEMGWWAMSSDTPETLLAFKADFESRFLRGHDDTLVLLDCHI